MSSTNSSCSICCNEYSWDTSAKDKSRLPVQSQKCSHVLCYGCALSLWQGCNNECIQCPHCRAQDAFCPGRPIVSLIACELLAECHDYKQQLKLLLAEKQKRESAAITPSSKDNETDRPPRRKTKSRPKPSMAEVFGEALTQRMGEPLLSEVTEEGILAATGFPSWDDHHNRYPRISFLGENPILSLQDDHYNQYNRLLSATTRPTALLVDGAGLAPVNGIYHVIDSYRHNSDNAPVYRMFGHWNGDACQFVVYKPSNSNNHHNQQLWLCSCFPMNPDVATILMEDEISSGNGSSRRHDCKDLYFASSLDTGFQSMRQYPQPCRVAPPSVGWQRSTLGVDPPPTIDFFTEVSTS